MLSISPDTWPERVSLAQPLIIYPGAITALVGPNGAGKSSALNWLSGASEAPGNTRLYNRQLQRISNRERAQLLTLLPQQNRPLFEWWVWDLVALALQPLGYTPADQFAQQVVAQWLARLDLVHLAQRSLHQLSGGELQRVWLAQVMVQMDRQLNPYARFLLLDEPFNHLDLHHQQRLCGCLTHLAQQGMGIAVAMHDLSLAHQWVDRVCLFHQQQLYAQGTTRDVLTPQLIESVFQVSTCFLGARSEQLCFPIPTEQSI